MTNTLTISLKGVVQDFQHLVKTFYNDYIEPTIIKVQEFVETIPDMATTFGNQAISFIDEAGSVISTQALNILDTVGKAIDSAQNAIDSAQETLAPAITEFATNTVHSAVEIGKEVVHTLEEVASSVSNFVANAIHSAKDTIDHLINGDTQSINDNSQNTSDNITTNETTQKADNLDALGQKDLGDDAITKTFSTPAQESVNNVDNFEEAVDGDVLATNDLPV